MSQVQTSLEFLNWKQMTRTAEKFVFPEFWFVNQVPKTSIPGVIAEWDSIKPQIELDAAFTNYDGVATEAREGEYGHQAHQMPITFKFKTLNAARLSQRREIGGDTRNGRAYVAREQRDLSYRYGGYLDEWMLSQMFTGGFTITLNGVSTAINFNIPASHKPTATTTWNNTTTDIHKDLTTWKRLITKDTGRTPTTVICNQSVMDMLTKNDRITDYVSSTPLGIQIAENGFITRFHGLNWVVIDTHFASAGSVNSFDTPFIADNQLILTPRFSQDWLEFQRGSVVIPNSALNDWEEVPGQAFWSRVTDSPTGYTMYFKYARFPILRIPACLVYAKVVP